MLELEAYVLMEKKNDETWYLFFMLSILDCFEFFSIYYRNDYGTNMDFL